MKIAVLSDIHGNIAALEAVLADVAGQAVDRIVNLGDICSGALYPAETAARLMALDLPTIRGNHERQVLEQVPGAMGLSDRHAAATLRADQRDWFASLPATLRLRADVLMVHGSPASDLEYFLETVTPQGMRAASPQEAQARAGNHGARLILCGHSHVPRAVSLADGCLVVNPGSVGLQAYAEDRPWPHAVENGTPHARYALVDDAAGHWQADLRAVAYDWEEAARVALSNDRPDWARALRTGRV